jgi:uncharacterized protein (DUF1800 family)
MLTPAPDSWTVFEAAHLLNRAGFGGSPSEIKTFHALGRTKAVDSLLNPGEPVDAIAPPEWSQPEKALEMFREYRESLREATEKAKSMPTFEGSQVRRAVQKKYQRLRNDLGREAEAWWMGKILATKAPLREKMTLFWHDHFATSFQKVKQPPMLVRQNELFRTHAFGDFRALTQSVAKDPAMMSYLDSQNSRKGSPNENFAREVMELFTLGEGNYTEDDIREAAKAFTGYRIDRSTGTMIFQKRQWDDSQKTVFGKKGAFTGEDVIDLIFQQKAAATYVPSKLWAYFVTDEPPAAVVDALGKSFRAGDFNTGALLREIFLSQDFYAEAAMRTQIKPPVQFITQMLKQLEVTAPPSGFELRAGRELGQQLFSPPNVAGWDWGKAWINTNTLLTRYNLAGYITKGADDRPIADNAGGGNMMEMMDEGAPRKAAMRRPDRAGNRTWNGPDYEKIAPRQLRENPADLVDALIFRFFQGTVPDKARGSFIEYATAKQGVVFTNKEVAELVHLMLSTPYYQLS